MPPVAAAIAAFATWVGAGVVAVTGSITLGTMVASAIGWLGSAQGLMAIASLALAPKPPKYSDPGRPLQFRASPNEPNQIVLGEGAVGGTLDFATTFGIHNEWLCYVVSLCDAGPIDSLVAFKLDGETVSIGAGSGGFAGWDHMVTTGKYAGNMAMQFRAGSLTETHYNQWTVANVPEWTAAHKLSGVAQAYWTVYYQPDVFTLGVPAPLWVLKGVKCYDPRLDSTYPGGSGSHRSNDQTTWAWSDNGALIALTYAIGWRQGTPARVVAGMGAPVSMIDVDSFVEAANVAEANGWKCNGAISEGDDKAVNLQTICATFGGQFTPRAGKLGVTFGAAQSSVLTLTDDDLAGSVKFTPTRPRRGRYNEALGYFVNPADRYSQKATELVSDATYLSQDGGSPRTLEVHFPLVNNATQAKQLTALRLADTREHFGLTALYKAKARQTKEGQCVTIDHAELGVAGKFKVMSRTLMPDGAVSLQLRSETDAKYTWAMALTNAAPTADVTNRYDAADEIAPTGWSAAAEAVTAGGATIPIIRVTGAVDSQVAGSILVEFKPHSESDWRPFGEFSRDIENIEVSGLTPATLYDVAVSYRVAGQVLITPRQVISSITTTGTLGSTSSGGLTSGISINAIVDAQFRIAHTYWPERTNSTALTVTDTFLEESGLRKAKRAVTGTPAAGTTIGFGQGFGDNLPHLFQVVAGDEVEVSVYGASSGCSARQLWVFWFDADGEFIGYTIAEASSAAAAGDGGLETFVRLGAIVTAPAGAYTASLSAIGVCSGAASPWVIWTCPLLRKAHAGQVDLSEWSIGREADLGANITEEHPSAGVIAGGVIVQSTGAQPIVGAQIEVRTLADGEAISWGPYAQVPDVNISLGGLALPPSGSRYKVWIEGAGLTGGTVRLKHETEEGLTSVSSGPMTTPGGSPTWQADKTDSADAADNYYRFRVQGYHNGTSVEGYTFDEGGAHYYSYQEASLVLAFYANDGGGWDLMGTRTVSALGSYDEYFDIPWSAAIGQHGGKEFGVAISSSATGDTITGAPSITYNKDDATPTYATASPNGERALILITPRPVVS